MNLPVKPSLLVYILLAVSFLLTIILFSIAISAPATCSPSMHLNATEEKLLQIQESIAKMSNGAKEIESECAASVSQVRSLVAGMSKDTQKIETDCTANISQLSSKVSEVTTRLHSLQILQSQLQEEISTLKEKYLLCNFNQGWLHFQNKCYYLSSSTADWRKAKENCIGLQSHLAVVTTQKLQNLLQERTGDEKYWIGLSDIEVEGQWKWVDGTDYNSNEK
uniref:C-type lectin domain-containing protein n=1 Tax=Latimeria chalumnae TaxID=7897 RepID=H3B6G8_LATCH